MSYILDALKKSQSNPGGNTLNIDPISSKKSISVVWIWLLGLVLAINLFGVAWFLNQPDPKASVATPTTNQTPPTRSQPVVVETASTTPLPMDVVATAVEPRPSTVVSAPRVLEMELDDLEPAEQQRFTALKFTSHIYTDDPTLCAVVIDGQRLKNGDRFGEMTIYEITELGVIFAEQTTRRGSQITRRIEVRPFE